MKNLLTGRYIGNTPLCDLSSISPRDGVKIYAKLEMYNPTASIKDRIVSYIIERAIQDQRIHSQSELVEASSGNTASAVAMMAATLGLKAHIFVPSKTSQEKVDISRLCGAKVTVVNVNATKEAKDYGAVAQDYANKDKNRFFINQYDNRLNPEAHYVGTGVEIWNALKAEISVFVATGSTGGTITGVGRLLKEKQTDIQVVLADPKGSVIGPYINGDPDYLTRAKPYLVEGAGKNRLVKAFDYGVVDTVETFDDLDAFRACHNFAASFGMLIGGSSGGNLHCALKIAEKISPPATIVTIFPDSGLKYMSKIYNKIWLQSHKLQQAVELA